MKRKPKGGFGDNGFELWGGYMAAKKAKLQEQFSLMAAKEASETHKGIFHGIAIFVNGYTDPSADQLKRIMMQHGGLYHHYMTDRTTHIIATNLPDVKIKKLKIMRVVKPDWISDSIQAGKLLDYRLYLLYSHQSKTQPRLQFVPSNTDDLNSPTSGKSSSNDGWQEVSQSSSSTTDSHIPTCAAIVNDAVSYKNDNKNITTNSSSSLKVLPTPVGPQTFPSCRKLNEISILKTQTSTKPVECTKSTSSQKAPISSAKTAGEANFLSEFYNNSRLHHISTMGATFKQYVNELREKADRKFEGQEKLREWKKRRGTRRLEESEENMEDELEPGNKSTLSDDKVKVIMHIDMDCFFVSVGLRNRSDLRGQPVAVTHAKGNQKPQPRAGLDRKMEFDCYNQRMQGKRNLPKPGSDDGREINSWMDGLDDNSSMAEIASCSYEARKAGVKNGMFVGQALKLCPNLKTIPYDFEGYKEVSYTLYNTLARYTLDIEAVSCDELFVDCTSLLKNTGVDPLEFATIIRQEIKDQTSCPASTGFGANLLQARLATKRAKPDGQFHLLPAQVPSFMRDIKVDDLPGVGRSLSYKLQGLFAKTCGDLQQHSLFKLQREFGFKTGEALYRHCRGEDDRKLSFGHVRKSVSAEVNYGIRFSTQSEADAFFRQLAAEVTSRLKEVNMKARCITLKLMVRAQEAPTESAKFLGHGVCDHITKSTSLVRAVADAETITREVLSIQRQLRVSPSELRGIGIQLSRLEKETKTPSGLQNFLVKKSTCTNSSTNLPKELDVCASESDIIRLVPAKVDNFKKLDNCFMETSKGTTQHTPQPAILEVATPLENSAQLKSLEISKPRGMLHLDKQDNIAESLDGSIRQSVRWEGCGKSIDSECEINEEVNQKHGTQDQATEGDIDPEVFAALPDEIQEEILQDIKNKNSKLERRVTRGMSQPKDVSQLTNNSKQKSQDPIQRKLLETRQSNQRPREPLRNHMESQEPGPSRQRESQVGAPDMLPHWGTIESHESGSTGEAPDYNDQDVQPMDEMNYSQIEPSFLAALPDNVRKELKTDLLRRKAERSTSRREHSTCLDKNILNQEMTVHERQQLNIDEKSKGPRRKKHSKKNLSLFHQPPVMNNATIIPVKDRGKCPPVPVKDATSECGIDPNLTVPETRALLKAWVSTESVPQPCDVDMLARHFQQLAATRKLESLDLVLKCFHRCVSHRKSSDWEEAFKNIINKTQNTMQIVYGAELQTPNTFTF